MRVCIICEGVLPVSDYTDGSPICKSCVSRLVDNYGVDYHPPEKRSKLMSWLNLILAIREQAEMDNEIEDFEEGWLYATPFNQIFGMVRESVKVENYSDGRLADVLAGNP